MNVTDIAGNWRDSLGRDRQTVDIIANNLFSKE